MKIRDRIKELRRVKASQLRRNPKNWRTHPRAQQDALRGVLTEIGYADALLAREFPDGTLEILDGHLRAETTPNQKVPVLILDLTDKEADKFLATCDPLGAMAESDKSALKALLSDIETTSESVQRLLDELAAAEEDREVPLRPLQIKPPPKLAWVLMGIPLVRFGEIAQAIDDLSRIDGIILETTQNDGRPDAD